MYILSFYCTSCVKFQELDSTQIIPPTYLNFNNQDSLRLTNGCSLSLQWLLAQLIFGGDIWGRCSMQQVQVSLSRVQAESSSWTPARLPSLGRTRAPAQRGRHVSPSGYDTSACSATAAVMAEPFFRWAKSSSVSQEFCMINEPCFLGPHLFLMSGRWDVTNMKTDCELCWQEIRRLWWLGTFKTLQIIFVLFDSVFGVKKGAKRQSS